MGICLSTTKVSGSNSGSNNNNANHHRNANKEEAKRRHNHHARNDTTHKHQHQHQERAKNYQQLKAKQHQKTNSRRQTGVIPCGKRTDFGYDKDFDRRYTIGKLLGHGQFGYTYVATDKANGDRVAVKKIEKNKMILPIAVEDVKREVKILQALAGHENVVKFYNAFEDDNYVYIAME